MTQWRWSRVLHTLGVGLFMLTCISFFFLPGDAPSSRAKRERPHNPVPWVLWVGGMLGSGLALGASHHLSRQEEGSG